MISRDEHEIIALLKRLNAHVTQSRVTILKVLAQCAAGLTVAQIIKCSSEPLDRITVYRTLRVFQQKGLIMVVPNVAGRYHYVLTECVAAASKIFEGGHLSYFICKKCRRTDLVQSDKPVGMQHQSTYLINNSYTVFEGLCFNCK